VTVLVLLLAGCGGHGGGGTFDSAGSTIERGAAKVGDKLDTAIQTMKRKVDEAQLESALEQFRGLEHVSASLSDDSVLTLTGAVASEADRRRAVELGKQLRGVRTVSNAIGIDSTRLQVPGDSVETEENN
jgi:osmotically-inducible protein OsmY